MKKEIICDKKYKQKKATLTKGEEGRKGVWSKTHCELPICRGREILHRKNNIQWITVLENKNKLLTLEKQKNTYINIMHMHTWSKKEEVKERECYLE
jgi:hypothetical protein